MKELYSNARDCYLLSINLKAKLKRKIEFYGSTQQEVISGKYFKEENHSFTEKGLPFYYKYLKDGFLRIQVGSFYPHNNSVGEKLAALSDFYLVLKEMYGEPTVFYTTKNDDEKTLALQWCFIDKEENIASFKNGDYFDDDEIDTLIVIGEEKTQDGTYSPNPTTKENLSKQIGLPLELADLISENEFDYIKFKTGKTLDTSDAKIDGVPVITFDEAETIMLKRIPKAQKKKD